MAFTIAKRGPRFDFSEPVPPYNHLKGTGGLRDLFEICRLPGQKRLLRKFLKRAPHLARRPIRYGKGHTYGIGFQTCHYPGRYYYGSAGYPDVSPFAAHIVAANTDDLEMLKVLDKFGASFAAKDSDGRTVYDVCRSELLRKYVKDWHTARGLQLSGKPIVKDLL